MTKIDPYKHEQTYRNWKEKIKKIGYIEGISKTNSDLIIKYVFDMELGINISSSSAKGSRSYTRLNNIKQRMTFLAKKIEEIYNLENLEDLEEEQIISLFSQMRKGEIKRLDGKNYKSVADFVKMFKAFWHWHMKRKRKEGKIISDITIDLDTSKEKPKWVYLNESQVKLLADNAKYKYKVLIWFLLDTGIRSPTELINIKVNDFYLNSDELNIRDEVSKTFGRRITLTFSSNMIKEYISRKKLEGEDYIFPISPKRTNEYLKRLAKRLLGENKSQAGEKYSNLTLYDFRHCSCCYWLPKSKSETGLMYRFGWKKSDKIHYYSEFIGMRDTIGKENLLTDTTKTELEKELINAKRRIKILEENERANHEKLREILYWIEKIKKEMKLVNR